MEIHVWAITKDSFPYDKDRKAGVYFWDAGDSSKDFERNKTDPRMDEIYLRGDKITYTLNSHGYRCKEFDQYTDDNFVLVLGCSHTYGTALHEHNIWHSYLGNHIGLPIMNLGNGGFGPDYVFTMSTLYNKFNMPKPKMVVIQWPQKFRKSFTYDIDGNYFLDPTHPELEDIRGMNKSDIVNLQKAYDMEWYFNRYITYNGEMEKINYVNYVATQMIWDCPVFNWSWQDDYGSDIEENYLTVYTEDLGRARDLQHDGRLIHEEAARQIYEAMENEKFI